MTEDTLKVEQNEDGTFSLEWDPNDPKWSWLNSMTEDEISNIISDHIRDNASNYVIADDPLTPEP